MYSIFHTSHCGSTLLSVMLSRSIDTVTEPKWSHDIRSTDDLEVKLKLVQENHKENLLVKYSSLCTEVAPHILGKKVFLFRDIIDHLQKIKGSKDEAKLWLYRWNNLLESSDVFFLQANHFFTDKHKACEDVCNHFNIEYKPIQEIDFHVKHAGYNHNDSPIKI